MGENETYLPLHSIHTAKISKENHQIPLVVPQDEFKELILTWLDNNLCFKHTSLETFMFNLMIK